jgi:hypothetical protein
MNDIKKSIVIAVITGVCLATLSAAAKSYIDVERLKTKMELFIDTVQEIKDDVKEIKTYLIGRNNGTNSGTSKTTR